MNSPIIVLKMKLNSLCKPSPEIFNPYGFTEFYQMLKKELMSILYNFFPENSRGQNSS